MYIQGLTEEAVDDSAHVMEKLKQGRKRLVFAETRMNRHSSRSHAMCIINVECVSAGDADADDAGGGGGGGGDDGGKVEPNKLSVRGKLTLCDLAGSERIKKTASAGTQLKEAQHINSSLLELGNCVAALSTKAREKSKADIHIPFRNSTLTRVLQDSLGGNCKTSLIVCCSPFMRDHSETKGTLQFGSRAMEVVQHAKINMDLDYRYLANLLARQLEAKESAWNEIEARLRRQIDDLEQELTEIAEAGVEDLRQMQNIYEGQLKTAEDEFRATVRDLEARLVDAEAEAARSQAEAKGLQALLAEEKTATEARARELEALGAGKARVAQLVVERDAELVLHEAQSAELKDVVAGLTAQLAESQVVQENTLGECAGLEERCAAATELHQAAQVELELLKLEGSQQATTEVEMVAELAALRAQAAEHQAARAELAGLRVQAAADAADRAAAQAALAGCRSELAALEVEVGEGRLHAGRAVAQAEAVAELTAHADALAAENDALKASVDEIGAAQKARVGELQAAHDLALEALGRGQQDQLAGTLAEVALKDAEVDGLRRQLVDLEAAHEQAVRVGEVEARQSVQEVVAAKDAEVSELSRMMREMADERAAAEAAFEKQSERVDAEIATAAGAVRLECRALLEKAAADYTVLEKDLRVSCEERDNLIKGIDSLSNEITQVHTTQLREAQAQGEQLGAIQTERDELAAVVGQLQQYCRQLEDKVAGLAEREQQQQREQRQQQRRAPPPAQSVSSLTQPRGLPGMLDTPVHGARAGAWGTPQQQQQQQQQGAPGAGAGAGARRQRTLSLRNPRDGGSPDIPVVGEQPGDRAKKKKKWCCC